MFDALFLFASQRLGLAHVNHSLSYVPWERRNVGRWASGRLDSVGDVQVTGFSRVLPAQGGVEAIESVELSIANGDLRKRRRRKARRTTAV
jgi:hypothetical protein